MVILQSPMMSPAALSSFSLGATPNPVMPPSNASLYPPQTPVAPMTPGVPVTPGGPPITPGGPMTPATPASEGGAGMVPLRPQLQYVSMLSYISALIIGHYVHILLIIWTISNNSII